MRTPRNRSNAAWGRELLLMAHRSFLSQAALARSYARQGMREDARKFGQMARRNWATVQQFITSGRCE